MMVYDADRRLGRRTSRIKRHWHWILAGATLCGLGSFVISLFLPKVYRTTTDLLVSESKIGPGVQLPTWQYATLPTYLPFVDNDVLIQRSIERFHLDRTPYNLTVDAFRRRDILDVRALKLTRLLEISVEFPDARLAADLANYLAQEAVSFNNNLNVAGTSSSRAFLAHQLEDATARFAETARRRAQVQAKARIEDGEKELTILLTEKEEISTDLQKLRLGLVQDEGKANSLQQALGREPRTFHLTKSILDDRYAERALAKTSPGRAVFPAISEEVLNTTQQAIQHDFVATQANVAAETAGVSEAELRRQKVNVHIRDLLVTLAQRRSEIDAADHDYQMARNAVDVASRNYENAAVDASAKTQDIEQLAPAVVPGRPVSPKPLLNSVLGTLIGLIVLGGGAAVRESIRDLCEANCEIAKEDRRLGVSR